MRALPAIIFSVFLFGCTSSVSFPEDDEPFVEYEYGDYGPDLIYNLYSKKITFYGNGQAKISTPINENIGIDENAPHTIEFELSNEAVNSLKSEIEVSDFFSLPEDVSQMDVVDGGYEYLTVFTENQTKTSGGSNPDNKILKSLSDQILQAIPDDTIASFNEGIKKYQSRQGF